MQRYFMNRRSRLIAHAAFLVWVATFANAASKSTLHIKVLDSETRSFNTSDDNGVPRNCDGLNYDAYCHSSKTVEVINTLLVQADDQPPFRVACSIDSKWSRCIPLLRGESYAARREKRGITIYYQDDNGKVRKQLYTYVAENSERDAASFSSKASPPPTEETGSTPAAALSTHAAQEAVKCSFDSTPSGAEITLDGQFVGSTPSVLDVSVGRHTVQVSLPGFVQWKRTLTVSSGSRLTVNAILQRSQ